MQRDDTVVYLAHPDWGDGVIEFVAPNGMLTISFEIRGEPFRDDFSPFEVEMAAKAKTAA